MNRSNDQAVTLHLTNGLGQHLLADIPYKLSETCEPDRAVFLENLKHQHRPFIRDPFYDLSNKGFNTRINLFRSFGRSKLAGAIHSSLSFK